MKLLAIDTCANLCAACVHDAEAGGEVARAVLDIGKGHAEQIMAVIGQALGAAGIGYEAIGAVVVSVGPGSFTGVRVGVSAARGLALALSVPAIGVSTLEALAAETGRSFPGRPVLVAIGNRPQALYAAAYDGSGAETTAPLSASAEDLAGLLGDPDTVLAGSAATLVLKAAGGGFDLGPCEATADIAIYAGIAAVRGSSGQAPRPLYLRPPDARPQSGFTLPMKTA